LKILGIDVCTGFCSVAVVDGGTLRVLKHEPMIRGHAERLAPMVSEVCDEAGIAPTDFDGIAVTTGPGSFTGARLGVSFARGLAMATGIPAVGVTVFEALAAGHGGEVIIALDGKNGSFLLQRLTNGHPATEPAEFLPEAIADISSDSPFAIIGPAAAALFAMLAIGTQNRATLPTANDVTAQTVALLGTAKLQIDRPELPAPLYLRPADAKPQAIVSLS